VKFAASIFRVPEVAGFSDTLVLVNQTAVHQPDYVWFLTSGVFSYPEDGGDAFLRFLPNYTALQSYRSYSSRFMNLYARVTSVGRIYVNNFERDVI
jgi:hypothetical protein